MEFRRIEEYKPEFAVDDFLTIAQKTKNTSLLYVDEVLGDGLLNSKHEANLVKQHLEKVELVNQNCYNKAHHTCVYSL